MNKKDHLDIVECYIIKQQVMRQEIDEQIQKRIEAEDRVKELESSIERAGQLLHALKVGLLNAFENSVDRNVKAKRKEKLFTELEMDACRLNIHQLNEAVKTLASNKE